MSERDGCRCVGTGPAFLDRFTKGRCDLCGEPEAVNAGAAPVDMGDERQRDSEDASCASRGRTLAREKC